MSNLHIAHRALGGVSDILTLLSKNGDQVIYLDENKDIKIHSDGYDKVFFHQPAAHFFLCKSLFNLYGDRSKCILVLHEASNYNFDAWSFRSYLTTLARFSIVNFLSVFFECFSVSKFVSNSYWRKFRIISYCYLYSRQLKEVSLQSHVKSNIAVIWVRRGDAAKHFKLFKKKENFFRGFRYVVLGDPNEVFLIKKEMLANKYQYFDYEHKLDFKNFLYHLSCSKLYISLYEREGFGLSTFFAAYLGNVIFTSRSGAVLDWLPQENYELERLILNDDDISYSNLSSYFDKFFNDVFEINKCKCLEIMNENE
ncbi:hypothetical protein [Aeromonas veronii]|uniref:hypothetical protein n=1 Tax=Aeromonas veronii TaxID=654 RepID=UPI002936D8B2|nr:hypothetical protein [Aeromonas veronii]WOE83561.1 hypothetical protein RY930_16000 [Aeromonas veronii]